MINNAIRIRSRRNRRREEWGAIMSRGAEGSSGAGAIERSRARAGMAGRRHGRGGKSSARNREAKRPISSRSHADDGVKRRGVDVARAPGPMRDQHGMRVPARNAQRIFIGHFCVRDGPLIVGMRRDICHAAWKKIAACHGNRRGAAMAAAVALARGQWK